MAGHGGFPISRRVAERASQEMTRSAAVGITRPGTALGIGSATVGLNFGDGADRTGAGRDMKGFRNFLSASVPPRRLMIDGQEPLKDDATEKELRHLMSRLAQQVDCEFPWPDYSKEEKDSHPGLQKWENPRIPSGYTYLLQLVAHDLVSSSFPISILEETTTGTRNGRSAALRLDTIYGGGPAACPFAYAPDDGDDTSRTALRLGPVKGCSRADPAKLRDIVRMPAPNSDGAQRLGLIEVAIADPRNDDNAVISQMTVLFHLLHRAILSLLPRADKKEVADSELEAAYDRFLCARGAVTLIYRNIIRKDLLKRILHPAIYEFYRADKSYDPAFSGFEFLEKTAVSPAGDTRIPLEFSHAAFRFGHAMVRPTYRFNERADAEFDLRFVLKQTSAKRPTAMPFEEKWIVRWSKFFEIDGSKPNLSRRIGPEFSADFLSPDLFPPIDEDVDNKAGLAYRDLLVGGFLNLWSGQGLIDAIKQRSPDLFRQSKLLEADDYSEALREFLTGGKAATNLSDKDIEILVKDTPLAFFVLFEAATDRDAPGLRLGPLGSIIVAEVILSGLTRDPVTGESGANSLKAALEALSVRTYKRNYLGDVDEINSMSELIKFVARVNKLEDADPGFV